MPLRGIGLALIAVVVVASGGLGTAVADGEFDLTLSPAVDTPPRTVELDGIDYRVSAVGRVDPGDPVQVTVSAPSTAEYRVLLYNAEKDIVDFERAAGDDYTFSFATADDAGDYPPGSYLVAVSHDGVTETVHPVVLSAYHVTVSAPDSATVGTTIDVEASVTEVAGDTTIEQVQVVIGNADDERTVEMAESSSGQYAASVALDTLGSGDYSLYVVVQGPDEVFGRQELLGLSDSRPFAITEPTPTPTATDPSGGASGAGGGGGGLSTPTDTPTPTPTASTLPEPTPTDTPTPTDAPSPTVTGTPSPSPTPTASPSDTPTTREPTAQSTIAGNVITPGPTPSPTVPASPPSQDGPGFALALLAVVVLLVWRRR